MFYSRTRKISLVTGLSLWFFGATFCVYAIDDQEHSSSEHFDTPESAIVALWNGISHEPMTSANIDILSAVLHENTIISGVRKKDDVATLSQSKKSEFLASLAEISEQGFYECEVLRKVEVYENFASAISIVESRFNNQQALPDFTGVNSIQLFNDGEGWKIIKIYYQTDTPENQISLQKAKSGVCLNK